MVDCSIVVPVYNHASVTRHCLNALLENPPQDVEREIVVVDDASTDITPELLASYGSQITWIRHQQNRGFAHACNDGAAAASGGLLVFLNNDIQPARWRRDLPRGPLPPPPVSRLSWRAPSRQRLTQAASGDGRLHAGSPGGVRAG